MELNLRLCCHAVLVIAVSLNIIHDEIGIKGNFIAVIILYYNVLPLLQRPPFITMATLYYKGHPLLQWPPFITIPGVYYYALAAF